MLNRHFVFITLLISVILSAATSVFSVYLQSIATAELVFWQYFFHEIYYIFHDALSTAFALYIMNVTSASAGRGRRFFLIFLIPFFVSEILVFINIFSHIVFYMDDEFVYHRGPVLPVLYVIGLLYLILAFVYFFRYKKAISHADSRAIGILMLLSAAGVIIQALRSEIAVELFAESLTLLGMMIMLEERGGYTDAVTGALNREALISTTRRLIGTNQSFNIVLVKLTNMDLFTRLFDGREMDNLMMDVAAWLTSISSEETLYSYRSENFAIIYQRDPENRSTEAADTILERFGKEWKSGEATLKLDVAVSIVRIPIDISTTEDLIEMLTLGDYKKGSGSRLVPYDEILASRHDREIEQALRDAVDNKKLRVWYQPIWSVEKQRTIAAEALLRIDSEMLRQISPEVYIPIAEQTGIIRDIGLFVFEDVCRLLQSGHLQKLGLSYIELNLSVYQFMYDDLVELFENIRKKYSIPVESLNLEITESASTSDAPIVEQTMKALRDLGYTFSLDDFGTGYSNLKELISSTYTNVKIDKSLLWKADHNDNISSLLEGLIRLIRSLDYNVVQEGVETVSQLERTAASGGNLIQGYYFSRPLPENDFVSYLENEAKKAFEAKKAVEA